INNVLSIPTRLYQISDYDGSELSIAGWYDIPRKLFSGSELPRPIGDNFDLLVLNIKLTVAQDEESWQNDQPFTVELDIYTTMKFGPDSPSISRATKPLSIGHLWAAKDRQSGTPISLPIPAYGRTFEDFKNELLTSMLAHIIRRPKATLRWDDQGLVASVNIGNTYISTREHSV